jgi:deoxyribodipyrimidine photolyase
VTAIVSFRRDLRVYEHPALRAALGAHDGVVPVFCFDDRVQRNGAGDLSGLRVDQVLGLAERGVI